MTRRPGPAARLVTLIGTVAVSAITRMMGFILAVIGVQMFIEGMHGAFGFGGAP